MEFARNMVAIGLGAGIGYVFSHVFEHAWILGIFLGGCSGYVLRQLTEPTRIIEALMMAWKGGFAYRLPCEWREHGVIGLKFGLVVAGVISFSIGGVFTLIAMLQHFDRTGTWMSVNELLFGIGLYIGVNIFVPLAVMLIAITVGGDTAVETQKNMAWATDHVFRLNGFCIPFYVVYLLWRGIWTTMISSPRWLKIVGRFLLEFCRLIHSEAAMACGVWALIVGAAVFLFVPTNPTLIVLSFAVGAAIGAGMRPLVLRMIPPPTLQTC